MKRIICIILCCICVCFGFSGCGSNFSNSKISQNTEGKIGTYNVISPDGNLTVKIEKYLDGRMYYTVNKNGIALVETSNLGLEIEEDDFNLTTVTNISSKRITGSYENISGKSKVVSYDCNELTISLSAWYFNMLPLSSTIILCK